MWFSVSLLSLFRRSHKPKGCTFRFICRLERFSEMPTAISPASGSTSANGGTDKKANFLAPSRVTGNTRVLALPPNKESPLPTITEVAKKRLYIRAVAALLLCLMGALSGMYRRVLHSPVAYFVDQRRPPPTPLPWALFYATQGSKLLADRVYRRALSPVEVVAEDAMGHAKSALLFSICELGVADAIDLAGGYPGSTVESLAQTVGRSTAASTRLIRAMGSAGYVQHLGYRRYVATPALAALRTDHPGGSLCPFVRHLVELSWRAWYLLPEAVSNASFNAHEGAYGTDIWTRLDSDPDLNDVMTAAMASVDQFSARELILDFDWGRRYSRILDIGGNSGSFVAKVLKPVVNKFMTGVVFDREVVIAEAERKWRALAEPPVNSSQLSLSPSEAKEASNRRSALNRVLNRMTFTPGDLFNSSSIPRGQPGDGFLMRVVLHDFSDEECGVILDHLRLAMTERVGDRIRPVGLPQLVLIEQVLGSDPAPIRGTEDLHMMVVTKGGRERTMGEWRALLSRSGFVIQEVVSTRSLFSVIVTSPIVPQPLRQAQQL